ncbi:MAG TPA: type II toxin-antitoxin system antitoxin SocA domain-containing protein [Ignavibacteriales bacterium]|nr:type II toxin-antitoxin system antitoxin SocA domain-containing protein [Ignavibacteriales bacterium]
MKYKKETNMYNALQAANYFIKKALDEGIPVDPMKLQKLLYFAYGWYYAYYDKPLFRDQLKAWQWGPVIEDIYHAFKKYGATITAQREQERCIMIAD